MSVSVSLDSPFWSGDMKRDERWWGTFATITYLSGWILVASFRRSELFALTLNELGDFLAGSFGPIAFFWLVLGYIQQGKELKVSSDALRLQAAELKSSVEAQRDLVEVSRAQVAAELESAAESKLHRISLIKPFFVGFGAGASHSGDFHKMHFAIKNLGAPVSRVVFAFHGEFADCTRSAEVVDRGQTVNFEHSFIGNGDGVGDILHIAYLDADLNVGEVSLKLYIDNSKEHPVLVVLNMSEDRERVLRMALKAVLVAAQECWIDIDELTEIAFQSMLGEQFYDSEDVGEAASATSRRRMRCR
jgi:hypothetical protein